MKRIYLPLAAAAALCVCVIGSGATMEINQPIKAPQPTATRTIPTLPVTPPSNAQSHFSYSNGYPSLPVAPKPTIAVPPKPASNPPGAGSGSPQGASKPPGAGSALGTSTPPGPGLVKSP